MDRHRGRDVWTVLLYTPSSEIGPSVKRNGPNVTFHALSNDMHIMTLNVGLNVHCACIQLKSDKESLRDQKMSKERVKDIMK